MKKSHWLEGAIDLHVHSGPDVVERYGTCQEIAMEAAEAGMRALVFKDHFGQSVLKAKLTAPMVPDIDLFGGICLNHAAGGIYPRTVEWAIKVGAKVVMMPTMDSYWMVTERSQKSLHFKTQTNGRKIEGIKVLDDQGKVIPELDEILTMIAQNDLILSTGHLGPKECLTVVKRAKELKVDRIMVEHPNFYPDYFSMDILKDLVKEGAYLSLSFGACHPFYGRQDPRNTAEIINTVGAAHCNLITDFGQAESPSPVEGMRVWCEILVRCGISRADVEMMIKENPAKLLGM